MAAVRLTAPSGVVVNVDESKVDAMLARGFSKDKPAKKAASSSKSEK